MKMLLDYFIKGGLCMWPLLALSILALAIILEKARQIWEVQKNKNVFIERVLAAAAKKPTASKEEKKEAVEIRGRQEIRILERHIDWLATVAGAAPLLGFLGTVTGMVRAFQVIQVTGGPVSPALLAGGIWEALITTVFGLSISIPCVFAYNFFVNRIENLVLDVEDAANELIENIPA
jgi:biopolymer transport protein ExbB